MLSLDTSNITHNKQTAAENDKTAGFLCVCSFGVIRVATIGIKNINQAKKKTVQKCSSGKVCKF